MDTSPAEFYARDFFDRLGASEEAPRAIAPSEEIARVWGVRPAPELARLLDFLGTRADGAAPELGDFHAFAPEDWLPGDRNAFDFMLGEWFRRIAMLNGTLPIGSSGCGDIWLVALAPRDGDGDGKHAVYLHDHDEGVAHLVADSIESFAWMCHLFDTEEERAEAWAPLAGRVRGTKDIDGPSALALAPDDAAFRARGEAQGELLAALWHGPRFETAPRACDEGDVSAAIEAGLRAYLREEDGALATPAEPRILADMMASLAPKRALRGYEARLRALGTVEG